MLQSIRKDVALFILSIILFVGFPSVDVWMASLFYNGTFFLKDNLIAYAIYTDFGLLPFYLLPTLIFFSVFNFYKFK